MRDHDAAIPICFKKKFPDRHWREAAYVGFSGRTALGNPIFSCGTEETQMRGLALDVKAVRQSAVFFTRGSVVGGESIFMRASADINQTRVFFTASSRIRFQEMLTRQPLSQHQARYGDRWEHCEGEKPLK